MTPAITAEIATETANNKAIKKEIGAREIQYYNNQVKWYDASEDVIRAQAESGETNVEILEDKRDIPVAKWSERHAFFNTADGRKAVDAAHEFERTAKASAAAEVEADKNWSTKTTEMSAAGTANYMAQSAISSA